MGLFEKHKDGAVDEWLKYLKFSLYALIHFTTDQIIHTGVHFVKELDQNHYSAKTGDKQVQYIS